MRVITNKQARIIVLTWPKTEDQPAGRLQLAPGANEIADDVAERAMATSGFKMFARSGALRVKGIKPTPKAAKAEPADIKTMNAKDAIAHVEKVSDLASLDSWLGTEERSTVTAAIAKRIGALSPTAADEDEDEGQDDDGDEG